MANLKGINPLSDWIALEMDDKSGYGRLLEPPVFRVRLKPLTDSGLMDMVAENVSKPSEILIGRAIEAIQDWDLTEDGKPIPCTDEEKKRHDFQLRLILTSYIKGPEIAYIGTEIIKAAQSPENFLKN